MAPKNDYSRAIGATPAIIPRPGREARRGAAQPYPVAAPFQLLPSGTTVDTSTSTERTTAQSPQTILEVASQSLSPSMGSESNMLQLQLANDPPEQLAHFGAQSNFDPLPPLPPPGQVPPTIEQQNNQNNWNQMDVDLSQNQVNVLNLSLIHI